MVIIPKMVVILLFIVYILGLRDLLFSMSKNLRVVNIPNILDTIEQYQVEQKEFKTNTGGRESNIYLEFSTSHFIKKNIILCP